MQLLITLPRSGSHVFAQMMKFKMVVTFRKGQSEPRFLPQSKEETLEILRTLLEKKSGTGKFWMHLAFEKQYLEILDKCEDVFLLLRDPRDVIVSCAHVVEHLPMIGLNFLVDGKNLCEFPFSKRIDFFIDTSKPMFEWYESWRLCGFHELHYEDLTTNSRKLFKRLSILGYGSVAEIEESARKKNRMHFRTGKIGNWKTEFTDLQKKKALENFGELIENWNCSNDI